MSRQPLSAAQKEQLRKDGNFVGVLLMMVVATLTFLFPLLLRILRLTGVMTAEQVAKADLGLGNLGYMLLYGGVYMVSMGMPLLLGCWMFRNKLSSYLPLAQVRTTTGIAAVFVGVGGCIIANMIANSLDSVLRQFGIEQSTNLVRMDGTLPTLWMGILVWAVLPAVMEELLFRGCILGALRRYGDWFAIVVSALLFGLIHGELSKSVFAMMVGLLLGYVTVSIGNIFVAMLIHFLNNALSVWLQHCTVHMPAAQAAELYARMLLIIAFVGVAVAVCCVVARSPLMRRLPTCELKLSQRLGGLWVAPLMLIGGCLVILRIVLVLLA